MTITASLKENIPILSIAAVFMGYLNYHFYYSQFDIQIESYLTTSELILSFLPATIPFLEFFVMVLFTFVGIALTLTKKRVDDTKSKEQEKLLHDMISVRNNWLRLRRKLARRVISVSFVVHFTLNLIGLIISLAVEVGVVVYVIVAAFNLAHNFLSVAQVIVFSIIWICFIYMRNSFHPEPEIRERSTSAMSIMIVVILINLMIVYNRKAAEDVLNGKAQYEVRLEMESQTFATSDSIIFLGKTAEYIFFRNLSTGTNEAYKMETVKHISLLKND